MNRQGKGHSESTTPYPLHLYPCQASRALALYFSDPRARLAKFILSKADVDDFEVRSFG